MAKKGRGGKSEFHVVLDGLDLPTAVHDKIESAIRKAVLEQLAMIDLEGDLVISPLNLPIRGGGPTTGIVAVGRAASKRE